MPFFAVNQVRILDQASATRAKTRVLIEFYDKVSCDDPLLSDHWRRAEPFWPRMRLHEPHLRDYAVRNHARYANNHFNGSTTLTNTIYLLRASVLFMVSCTQASDMPWSTVGVNTNIISASMNALMDGLEYALVEFGSSCAIDAGAAAKAAPKGEE